MKLVLVRPAAWRTHHLGDGPVPIDADPAILVAPLVRAEATVGPWRDRVLHLSRPPFSIVEEVTASPGTSELGWPIEVVETRLVAGGQPVERRLSVLYFMLEWWSAAIFRATDAAAFTGARDAALAVLRGARPDWSSGEIVALAQLFGE